jgi:hypothetical protein
MVGFIKAVYIFFDGIFVLCHVLSAIFVMKEVNDRCAERLSLDLRGKNAGFSPAVLSLEGLGPIFRLK